MDYKYINQLLELYWDCKTTLEEEEILRSFFSQIDIPEEFEKYRPLFLYEQVERKTNVLGNDFDEKILSMIDEPIPVKARNITFTQRLMPLFRAAAIVAIILTLGMPHRWLSTTTEQTTTTMAIRLALSKYSKVQPWPSLKTLRR